MASDTSVTVILALLFAVVLSISAMPHQLIVSARLPSGHSNPVVSLLHRPPQSVPEQFTEQLMTQLQTIRHHCEELEEKVEREMEQKLRNLSQYQDYINDILNNEYSNITDEDKQIIQDGFRVAFEKLFTEDEEQERMISVNCSQQFQSIVADKMDIALQYAHTVLQQSTSQFATLVQDIVQYGGDLTSALTQCLSLYESQDNKVVNPLMKGSSSYECKQVEIQILSQFVYEFVVKSSGLLGGRDLDMGAWPSDIPEIFPRPEPVTDEPTIKWAEPLSKEGTEPSNELSTQGAEPSNESSKEGAEPSNKPSNEGAEPSNESSNESSNEGAEPSNESSNEGAEPSNEPSNEGAEPSNEPSNEEPDHTGNKEESGSHDNSHHGNKDTTGHTHNKESHHDRTHSGHDHDHTHHHHGNGKPHPNSDNTPVADQHFNIQVVVTDPTPPKGGVVTGGVVHARDHSFTVLLVCGIVSGVLFVMILVIGSVIVIVKYRKYRTKSWNDLNENEKVSAMKQSGYVNPTYEFFDKVTQ